MKYLHYWTLVPKEPRADSRIPIEEYQGYLEIGEWRVPRVVTRQAPAVLVCVGFRVAKVLRLS